MDGVLPLEKGVYVPSINIAHMMHTHSSNFTRKLRQVKEQRPDFVERHCLKFGPAQSPRYSLDRILTVVMMIDVRRGSEIDLIISTLEHLESSDKEQFVRECILNFYKSVPNLRPEALPDVAN